MSKKIQLDSIMSLDISIICPKLNKLPLGLELLEGELRFSSFQ
ncbi:hypothetical protein NADRNF5_1589 [Nitrosopumilus adriaticus]|uniref:Uncharacterized protein n=1 Tax=Nitrosopumilus adriaticus TaxID=1580092 RepID=A0A0D5C4I4_9ARCH|nr:hypothetical protein NADRNF5_1589 [Nitrosopumilus adriaticus]